MLFAATCRLCVGLLYVLGLDSGICVCVSVQFRIGTKTIIRALAGEHQFPASLLILDNDNSALFILISHFKWQNNFEILTNIPSVD